MLDPYVKKSINNLAVGISESFKMKFKLLHMNQAASRSLLAGMDTSKTNVVKENVANGKPSWEEPRGFDKLFHLIFYY